MEAKIVWYKQAHYRLLAEWKAKHKAAGYKEFVTDGVVCPEEWFLRDDRILFVLKEAYSDDKSDGRDWNLLDCLKTQEGSKGRIWTAVSEWQYALQNTTEYEIPGFDGWLGCPVGDTKQYRETRGNLLKQCAVINIKKSNGQHPSDDRDLSRYVSEDGDLLKQQIDIISPTLIVCGSTFHLLKDKPKQPGKKLIFGENTSDRSDRGCFSINSRTVIAYYHPANQYPAALNYYGIAGMYHNYLKQKDGAET